MTLVSVRIFRVMYDHTVDKTSKSPDQTQGHSIVMWGIRLMIAYGHFNLPQGLANGNMVLVEA